MATAVDYDPFVQAPAEKAPKSAGVPVEHDPFAAPSKKEKTFYEKVQPVTDVLNRGLIAETFGAPVDIAATVMRPFGYNVEAPVGGSEWIGKQLESIGAVSPKRRPVAEFVVSMAPAILTGGAAGARGIAKLTSNLANLYRTSKGIEAVELTNALRTQLGSRAEEIISNAQREAGKAGTELERTGKAQQELGAREPVAAARQTARERQLKSSLNNISTSKNVLAEDVGGVIQPQGRKNLERLRGERQSEAITKLKDPAFKEAAKREARGEYISTDPKSAAQFQNVVSRVERQIEATPEPFRSELRKRYASIRGEKVPLTGRDRSFEISQARREGRAPVLERVKPMTLEQAEFMRRMLKSRDLTSVEGFPALDAARMGQLGDELSAAMTAYEPRLGEYIAKYREMSAPITRALAGRGEALTDVELAKEEEALFSSDRTAATRYFLDGTEERARRLLDLTGGKNEALTSSIRGYFRSQLEGMTASQAQAFAAKNQGLFRVFPELGERVNAVVRDKAAAETMGVEAQRRAAQAATRLTGEARAPQQAAKEAEALGEKYKVKLNQLTASTPKESLTTAESLVNDLRKDRAIDDATHQQLLREISGIRQRYGDSAEAKRTIELLMRKVLIYSGYGLAGTLGYYGYKGLSGPRE